MNGITQLAIHDTPVAVVDCETTGLNPKYDRVVEVSVVRIEPGAAPRLVFDTLVNPERGVGATEIHGITEDDVVDAPRFDELAGDLARAMSGCVVTAYNAYFDVKFLTREFERTGIGFSAPHLCLMYMRPMLGLGPRCSLGDACSQHGIEHVDTHVASSDAFAASKLWGFYADSFPTRRVATFGDLASLKYYKFCESFSQAPLASGLFDGRPSCGRLTSRSRAWMGEDGQQTAEAPKAQSNPAGVYWESLKAIVYDLHITDEELRYLEQKRQELGLSVDEIRALHAKLFSAVISQFIDDRLLDDREARKLQKLMTCLRRLGWAPGD